ncbi:MAG: hypothetical protein JSS53_02760 [Proteobacteria bacterium]|nr:hypothetical protein [Pseudomonadota bacterium]
MKFFVCPDRVISKGRTVVYTDQHTEIHDPNATLIIDDKLEIGERGSVHIHVKDIIITPRGELVIHNGNVRIINDLNAYSNVSFHYSRVRAKNLSTYSPTQKLNWFNLRKQIVWAKENDPDSTQAINVKESVAHAEEKLRNSLQP